MSSVLRTQRQAFPRGRQIALPIETKIPCGEVPDLH